STSAMTAAALPSGTAPRPAASEDPMPLAQSGLNALITLGGRLTGAAPVTTPRGAPPPRLQHQDPRAPEPPPVQLDQRLGAAEPGPRARRQQHPGYATARGGVSRERPHHAVSD